MLKKTRPAVTGKAKVTFVLQAQAHAHHVHLAGDFNGWQSATPMKRQKDGSWRATLELDAGREYEFRYLVDGNSWVNDDGADAYVPNPFGADNSVVRVEKAPAAQRSGGRAPAGGTRSAARATGSATKGGTRSGMKGASKRGGGGPSPRKPEEGPGGSGR